VQRVAVGFVLFALCDIRSSLSRGLRSCREVLKAAAKIICDRDKLLAFYNYPAEHWIHRRSGHHYVPNARGLLDNDGMVTFSPTIFAWSEACGT
jgi:hypothetical protein